MVFLRLVTAVRLRQPVVRHYAWSPPDAPRYAWCTLRKHDA
jgi:hypothetical protein